MVVCVSVFGRAFMLGGVFRFIALDVSEFGHFLPYVYTKLKQVVHRNSSLCSAIVRHLKCT